ncbi:MAG: TSUP family transporter, partial [Prochlorococcaceae cyanobacterium]
MAAAAQLSAHLSALDLLLIALAAVAAGLVNAIAGGGSLISFPVLTAVGLPPVMANVTNTVALLPGYGGAAAAQRHDLRGQRRRAVLLLPAAALGGLLGGVLLLVSDETVFGNLVPWLILLGSGLLALQEPLRRWLLMGEQPAPQRLLQR